TGFEQGGPEGRAKALKFVADEYNLMRGGSSTYDALLRAVKEPTESIILAINGFLFKKHNQGLSRQAIVQQVTARNVTKKKNQYSRYRRLLSRQIRNMGGIY
ncbi:MAG: hypothetical protein VX930_18500, partial [Pseudomonadota bacterium]|nr:hypothetical protein [Pseudomonadota bacterium]